MTAGPSRNTHTACSLRAAGTTSSPRTESATPGKRVAHREFDQDHDSTAPRPVAGFFPEGMDFRLCSTVHPWDEAGSRESAREVGTVMAVVAGSVIVGVDGSPSSDEAVEWAAQEASHRDVALVLAHAVEMFPRDGPGYREKVTEAAQALLAAKRDDVYDTHPELDVQVELSTSSSTETLLDTTSSTEMLLELAESATLVVVGSRHHGAIGRMFLGSTSHALATRCPAPLAVVRARPADPDAPVAVGIDGTDVSTDALRYAFTRAQERKVPLHAVLAWQPADVPVGYGIYRVDAQILPEIRWAAEQQMTASLASLLAEYPDVEVLPTLAQQDPTTALVAAAAHAQMLVVGSHRHGTIARVALGSVSSNLLHAVPTPLVIVRSG